MGEREKAISCYEKAIQIDPNYGEVYLNLGMILGELGENTKALDNFKKALNFDIVKKKTLVEYGNLLLKLNEHLNGLRFINKGEGVIKFKQLNFEIVE